MTLSPSQSLTLSPSNWDLLIRVNRTVNATIDQVESRGSRCYTGERKYLPKTMDWNEMFKHFDEEIGKSAGAASGGAKA